jgi:hypothetical protein
MSDLLLFILGSMIIVLTMTAVILVGRAEAQDPAHNRTGTEADESAPTNSFGVKLRET